MARDAATISDYVDVTLDLQTVTLGELAAAEMASGSTYESLLRSRLGRKLLAMFIHELRTSDEPLSWSELGNLRLLDGSSSTPRSSSTETVEK